MGLEVLIVVIAFILVWFASELMLEGVDDLSAKIGITSFAASFFILGMLTAVPEFAIGTQSIVQQKPEIFVGEIIGSSVILFLFVIPLIAISSGRIHLSHHLANKDLIASLFVISLPAIITSDGTLSVKSSLILMMAYVVLFYVLEKQYKYSQITLAEMPRSHVSETVKLNAIIRTQHGLIDVAKVLVGASLLFFASKVIVDKTIFIAESFHMPAFIISLVAVSLGTNIPEIFIAIKSVLKKRHELAVGDYLGTSAANTFIFGLLLLINGSFKVANVHTPIIAIIFVIGLFLFYVFARTKSEISRWEGFILLAVYFFFILVEFVF